MTREYHINYHTQNTYEANVTEALFALNITPCQDENQQVRDVTFRNSLGEEVFHTHNPFGFSLTCIRSVKAFTNFEFWMSAVVEKTMPDLLPKQELPADAEQEMLRNPEFYIDHHLYLELSRYTQINPTFTNRLLHLQPGQPVYSYLSQLNTFIYNMLEFDPEPTHVHTTVDEVLDLGRGVCQDYTHLFLGIARHNKIPCRYVSGYLNQGNSLVGSAAMHAWVEAFVPGAGWVGFDPTNNLLADINHIKVAHGTDYNDCSPIKGMLKTSGGHKTSFGVKVVTNVPEMQQEQ
ncbi:transglutaminase family protein [Pontibacter qinzhouensis]|uniref:Transglutaminase family protein n=1 Tax=Pontibacter qinzhouensis TaxID=2603253 RepID=A0A5C8KBE7_9BACT|nr:transglutaminase family protein [Pontibacter qinzhouensis]TXK47944.1 transglutaminase family protein [Pontibacter qinzhouensis]